MIQEHPAVRYVQSIWPLLPDIKRLKLYVLSGNQTASVSITHAGGVASSTVTSNNSSSLKVYDIDLSTYTNVTTVSVSPQGVYMALVPEGASFNATSFNADGTAHARFDQNERLGTVRLRPGRKSHSDKGPIR